MFYKLEKELALLSTVYFDLEMTVCKDYRTFSFFSVYIKLHTASNERYRTG
uniref:Uncharacterized protein n=1 Tax=Arion vulgaris TaxID=1028688 RepID=A0A0B7BG30_9EUPU